MMFINFQLPRPLWASTSVRIFLSVASGRAWYRTKLDGKSGFLQTNLEECNFLFVTLQLHQPTDVVYAFPIQLSMAQLPW